MTARIIKFPVKIQFNDIDKQISQNELPLMEEDDIDEQYRAYYEWEYQFFIEHGYYPHNDPNDQCLRTK